MRKELKKVVNKRLRFSGLFERYGEKKNWHGYPETTVLLKDIRNEQGEIVSDHLWFNLTKGFEVLGILNTGDKITFEARCKPYVKGYVNYRQGIDERTIDYRLSHPTKFEKEIPNQLTIPQNEEKKEN